jgi:hypothetical protein
MAARERSEAMITAVFNSAASARATAPEPVPSSRILAGGPDACSAALDGAMSARAASTRHSVSGRGIRTSGVTVIPMDQNSRSPTM